MSIFGSTSTTSTICADYFGDEFGMPLPPLTINNNAATSNQALAIPKSTTILQINTSKNKNNIINRSPTTVPVPKPRQAVALAFAPNLDGLDFFETLVHSS
ncbi:hypothetical protein Ddye_002974 [Dipteronia dyeriana]|uniref:Uncharacterized protein n=1 Tax=Dipteronia dyeriana TaxID=168575 RepID=A0AAD9XS70_9ROSI|nr:hypothetical protein Ddye_002974 [Dipteronia dyeriana]